MLMAAAQNGWLNERAVIMESLLGIKRAGADAHPDLFRLARGEVAQGRRLMFRQQNLHTAVL